MTLLNSRASKYALAPINRSCSLRIRSLSNRFSSSVKVKGFAASGCRVRMSGCSDIAPPMGCVNGCVATGEVSLKVGGERDLAGVDVEKPPDEAAAVSMEC